MLCTNILLWTILDHSISKIETFMELIKKTYSQVFARSKQNMNMFQIKN